MTVIAGRALEVVDAGASHGIRAIRPNPFRDMAWLTPERVRLYAIAMAIAWTGLMVKLIWSLQGGYDNHGDLIGSDYASFWAASRMVLLGLPAEVYVPDAHRLAELPLLMHGYEAFYYPPTYLVLCIPLALLPFFPSFIIFQVATGTLFLSLIHRILRTPWSLAAALAFPVFSLNITPGQNAFLTASILGGGLGMLDRRPKLAGAILGLMVIKPHLALAVPIALILSRRWTALTYAAATALGLLVASYMIFGWDVWAAFLENNQDARDTLEQGLVGFAKMQSAFALVRLLGGGVTTAYVVQGTVASCAIYALIWARRRQASVVVERSLIVIASLLCTPFLLFYDMMIVAVPLAWMLREWMDRGFPPWSKLTLLVVFCMPIGFAMYCPMPFGLPALLVFESYLLWSITAPMTSPRPGRLRSRWVAAAFQTPQVTIPGITRCLTLIEDCPRGPSSADRPELANVASTPSAFSIGYDGGTNTLR